MQLLLLLLLEVTLTDSNPNKERKAVKIGVVESAGTSERAIMEERAIVVAYFRLQLKSTYLIH